MANDILRALDALAPDVRRAFLAAIADIKSEAQLAMVAGALERGDMDAVYHALNLRAEMFAPLDDALRAAYLQGGRNALAGLPVLTDPFTAGASWRALMAAIRARKGG